MRSAYALVLLARMSDALALYLARDRCDLDLSEDVVMMGQGAVRGQKDDIAIETTKGHLTANVSFRPEARYVEYVVETVPGNIVACEGTLGCGGARCAVRRFKGDRRPIAVRRGAFLRVAWALRYGVVSILETHLLPPVEWRLEVGCDRTGFFTELLGHLGALRDALGSDLSVRGLDCSDEELADLFDTEAAALKELTTDRQTPDALAIAHGARCSPGTVDVARLVVEREFAPGRDIGVYECALRAQQVWAPTRWAADQFVAAGATSVVVVPEAVNAALFSREAASRDDKSMAAIDARLGARTDAWTVLCVAKWERRKGLDVLLDGLFRLDDARLALHSYRPSWERGERNLQKVAESRRAIACAGRPRCAVVQWLGDGPLSRSEMRALYSRVDAFVLATRGEGWGLPIHEAMAMELPVVVTNASGIETLASPDAAILLPSNGVDDDGYARGPTARDVADALQYLRTNPATAHRLGKLAREHVVTLFSPHAVASIMRAELQAFVLRRATGRRPSSPPPRWSSVADELR
ncbi:hypothetical protein CTAYLR_005462 [Chrysophaeum taylorii]|uniref:Glycosyl transferase family 1 domain-containing protein n=1 Tax=Chrysophaeum taylorii TaxID=2483200 RepID=A0AAD7XSE9_9STRA|nr:hypothetical protein CTAYLR_005462 [Chrysophaeum taylorii]